MPQGLKLYQDDSSSSGTGVKLYNQGDESPSLVRQAWDKVWEPFDWFKKLQSSDTVKQEDEKYNKLLQVKAPPSARKGLDLAMMGDQLPYTSPTGGTEVLGNLVGSPGAVVSTASMAGSPLLKGAAAAYPAVGKTLQLGKVAKGIDLADRGLAAGNAVAEAPAFVDAIKKGDKTKTLGTAFGIGMGILGSKAHEPKGPGPAPKVKEPFALGGKTKDILGPITDYPPKPSYTLKNPSPRNIAKAVEEGYKEGPVLTSKDKKPLGQIMEADDTLSPKYADNIKTKVEAKYAEGKVIPKKKLIKDAQGNPVLDAEGKKTYEKFKKFKPTEDVQSVLKKWAGDRRAADIESKITKKSFADFDDKPLFDKDAAGNITPNDANLQGALARSKDYFNKKYGQLIGSGKKLGYREDYIPQMWDNTPAEVNEVFGTPNARLSLKKGFEYQRVHQNYVDGIAAGLTPKFDKLSDLTAFYEAHANKAIADRNFFQYLKDSGNISQTRTGGMVPISESVFPVSRTEKGQVIPWQASPEVASTIEGFLKPAKTTFLGSETLGKANRFLKTSALSAGVPWTGINFHGLGLATRGAQATGGLMDGKGFIPQLIENVKTLGNVKIGEDFVAGNMQKAADYTRYGLNLPTEHIGFRAGEKGESGFTGWAQRTFEDPLFQKAVPAFKIKTYESIRDNLVSQGLKFEEASHTAAQQTNHTFGSVDFKTMIANNRFEKTMKYLLDEQGSWFLAPQWLASHGYIAKDMAKAISNPADPKGAMYRNMGKNLALAYTYANVLNKTASGHWMGENEGGHFFDIDTGQKDSKGKHIYISPFGTEADFFRLPLDVTNKIISGQPLSPMLRGRAGPVPQIGASVFTGENWSGKPLKTPMDYVGLGTDYVPPYVRAPFNLMDDKISPLQAATDTFEIPMRYRRK